jgi:hypothetical protein
MSCNGITKISKKLNLPFFKIKGEDSEKKPYDSIGEPMVQLIN